MPNHWKNIPLKLLVIEQKGKKPRKLENSPFENSVAYLDINAIENKIISKYADKETSNVTSRNDLFIVADGSRSGWIGRNAEGAVGSTILALTPVLVNKDYIYYFLKTQFETLNKNTTGTSIPHVNKDLLFSLEIPLPPLMEQNEIAQKLEKVFSLIEDKKKRLNRIPKLIERYRQAVLEEAVTGKLTEEWRSDNLFSIDGWKIYSLQDVCISIADGDHQSPKKLKSGIPFIVISNIQNGKISFDNTMFVSEKYFNDLKEQRIPKKSNILFSIVGTIGLNAIVEEEKKFCFQRHIALLKPNHEFLFSKYLYYFLSSNSLLNQVLTKTKGIAQQTLNIRDLRNLEIRTPPLIEQQEIARQVEKLLSKADKAEAEYKKVMVFIDKLEQSVLQMAFSGQLSEAMPDDESVEKLLEKILEERKVMEAQRKLQRTLANQKRNQNRQKNKTMKADELKKIIQEKFAEKSFSFEQLNALLSFEDYDDFKEEFFKIAEEPIGNEKDEQFLEAVFNAKNPQLLFQIKSPKA